MNPIVFNEVKKVKKKKTKRYKVTNRNQL